MTIVTLVPVPTDEQLKKGRHTICLEIWSKLGAAGVAECSLKIGGTNELTKIFWDADPEFMPRFEDQGLALRPFRASDETAVLAQLPKRPHLNAGSSREPKNQNIRQPAYFVELIL